MFHSKSQILFAVAISCAAFLVVLGQKPQAPAPAAPAQEQPQPAQQDGIKPQCRGVDLKYSEEKMTNLMECVNATGTDNAREIPADKIPCFIKCVLNVHGLIDESGMPHKENIMKAIDSSIPGEVKEDLKAGFTKCLDEFGPKIDPKDETCMAFAPLSECMHMSYMNVCKVSM